MLQSSNKTHQNEPSSRQPKTEDSVAPEQIAPTLRERQFTPQNIMRLQSVIGNTAVQRLVTKPALQREDTVAEAEETEAVADETEEAAELESLKQDAEVLKGEETLLGEKVPITGDLIEVALPGRQSEPGVKGKHKSQYKIKEVKGKAFVGEGTSSISADEVRQGQLGDCYLLSALSAIAQANPQFIRDMISGPKDDGSYDVTLYMDKGALWWKKKSPVVINVQPTFPQDDKGNLAYGNSTKTSGDNKQLWPMLIEKAYAKHKGNYGSIEGGFGDEAMSMLTGKEAKRESTSKFTDSQLLSTLNTYLKNGYAVTVGTKGEAIISLFGVTKEEFDKAGVVSGHEYSLISVDVGAETVDIRNPWGYKHLKGMTIQDFKKYFTDFSSMKL